MGASDLSPAAEAVLDELAKLRHLEMCRVKIGGRCGCGFRHEARTLLAAYTAKVREEDARSVCPYCGGRALPDYPAARAVHGPNAAGNYVHHISPNLEELCKATPIWAHINYCAAIRARGGEEHHGA